jgi:hypothetical protein
MATTTGEPLVSVIVPVHDVAEYLDACLASATSQDLDAIEVIVVDDGSTDGSGEVADGWAERDPRVAVIHQENRGLGQARNRGVAAARGRYLAFLDGDDLVPEDAYRELVASLEATRSDVATGNVLRLEGGVTSQSPMHRGIFRRDRLATTVAEYPNLLRDRTATNKLWRRSFFDRVVGRFPEGVLYEDVFVVVPALARARSVDVLGLPVYVWRRRDGDTPSITQDRTDVRHVRDRAAAVTAVRRSLAEVDADLSFRYEVVALRELALFLPVFPAVDEAYRSETARAVRDFLAECDPGVLGRLDPARRIPLALLQDGRPDLVVPLVSDPGRIADAPITVHDGRVFLDLDLPIDPSHLDVTDGVAFEAGVDAIALDPGHLTVRGWARLDRRIGAAAGATVRVWAGDDADARIPFDTVPADGGRFIATVPPGAFITAGEPGTWRLGAGLVLDGLEWTGEPTWRPGLRGWVPVPAVQVAGEGVAVRRDRDDGVTVALLSAGPVVRRLAFAGDALVVSCVGTGGEVGEGWALELRGAGKTAGQVVPTSVEGDVMTAAVPADLVDAGTGSSWQLWLQRPRGKARRLRPGPGLGQVRRFVGDREVIVQRTRLDGIRVAVRRPQPLLVDASWDAERLHLEIDPPPVPPRSVVLAAEVPAAEAGFQRSGERLVADLVVPASGEWDVLVRIGSRERALRVSHSLLARFPLPSADGHRVLEPVDFDAVGVRAG